MGAAEENGGDAAASRVARKNAFAGRYQIGRVIGSGAVSVVLAAREIATDRLVAIKLLTNLGPVQVERFVREAKVTVGLKSEHIVEVLDAGVDRDQPYLVMERLKGMDFGRLIAKLGPQPTELVADYLLQVCDALSRAHRKGIVHRDIKASNLFVHSRPNGSIVKVLDFGISTRGHRHEREHTLTASETVLGSPPYMSPEQIQDPSSVDARADIWSLGVVAYRLISGRFPFNATTVRGMLEAVSGAPPLSLQASGIDVPEAMDRAIMRCLQRRCEDRFRNVGELAAAIEPLASEPWQRLVARITTRSGETPIVVDPSTDEPGTLTVDTVAPVRPSAHPTAPEISLDDAPTVVSPPPVAPPSRDDAAPADRHSVSPTVATRELEPAPRRLQHKVVLAVALASLLGGPMLATALRKVPNASASTLARSPQNIAAEPPRAGSPAGNEAPPAAPVAPPSCPEGMVTVSGGRFFMGSDEGRPAERPAHGVSVTRFCIDRLEVTAGAYKACSDRGDCKRAGTSNRWAGLRTKLARSRDPSCDGHASGRENHPMNCVDWSMADRFCRAEGKRLPTEAEWEFAARGSDGRTYPWGEQSPSANHVNACGSDCLAWLAKHGGESDGALPGSSDGFVTTSPVGAFPLGAAASGAQDMAGNVAEWVADWYAEYSGDDQVDPQGPALGKTRVIRGGAWSDGSAKALTSTSRARSAPEVRSHSVGFRCAKTP
jgi:formylglycine-generating enzyme required for sulfatase activity/serine/threonine protein kinase